MEKSKLEKFISKYNLGGSCESVIYSVEGSNLSTKAISDDKNVYCEIVAPSMGLTNGSYAVYETAKLRSLLSVMGETISVNVKKSSDKPVAMTFDDSNNEVTFVLADHSVIPVVPDLKKLPPFELTIEMDELFMNTFIKAKGALPDVDTFTVVKGPTDNTAEVILGYSSLNTNRVRLRVNTHQNMTWEKSCFSAKYLREILVANKDAKGGKLEISSKGLARTSFDVNGITSNYYLVQIDTKE